MDVRLRIPLLAFLLAALFVWPQFRTDYWSFVASLGLIWALLALSLSILIGWTGEVSLAHAAFLGMGAYAAGKVGQEAPFPVDLLAGVAIGIPISLLLGIPALRLRGLNLMVATAAFMLVMQFVIFHKLLGAAAGGVLTIDRPELFGLDFRDDQSYYYIVLISVATCFLITWAFSRTLFRRAFVAMGDDDIAFTSVGGNIVAHKLLAFALSGMAASLAGVLWGMLNRHVSEESLTVNQSVAFLTFAVVGGRGSLVGALLAGALFGVLPEVYRSIPEIVEYTFLMSGLGLIVLLLQAPGGLASIPGEMQRMFARRRQVNGAQALQREAHLRPEASQRALELLGTAQAVPDAPATSDGSGVQSLLTVQHLGIRFGGVTALSDVTLGIPPDAIVGLIGPNGAGKTTLLNCVSGFYRPQTGRVFFRGHNITDWPVSRRSLAGIARTFQTPKLFTNLTVEENVLVALVLRGDASLATPDGGGRLLQALVPLKLNQMRPPLPRDVERTHVLLSLVGLESRERRLASDLSHAEARALELARALASSPSLLLLDEPVAGMDRSESDAFGELLQALRQQLGVTIVVVEHDMTWVMGLCQQLFVLDFGLLLAAGTPEEIRENRDVIAAYLGRGVSHVGS